MAKLLGLLVACAVLFAGCLGGGDDAAPDAPGTGGPLGPVDETVVDMYVVATDHSLNVESAWKLRPASFELSVGDVVNITISNAEGNMFEHTLVIDELGVSLGPVAPGEQASTEVLLEGAGTYAFYCDVGNHRQLGMEGTLTVR